MKIINNRNTGITGLIIILFILIAMSFSSCQYEFNLRSNCDEINEYYDNLREELYASCPDKCDFSSEIKVIEKKRKKELIDADCY